VSTVDRFERWLTELLNTTSPMNVHIRPSNVREWLSDVVEIHRPMAQMKGIELIVNTDNAPREADFDPSHMDHALAAILSNAIEATPKKGKVWVDVHGVDDKLEIRVIDQGPGIAKELLAKVFVPHFTTKQHGTGMGLALSQQVVRAHHGRITVGNAMGEEAGQSGACFSIRLPLKATGIQAATMVENSH